MHANTYVHIHTQKLVSLMQHKTKTDITGIRLSNKSISKNISSYCFIFVAYKELGIKTTQSILLQVKWDICLRQ